jgi:hypothetical protein
VDDPGDTDESLPVAAEYGRLAWINHVRGIIGVFGVIAASV